MPYSIEKQLLMASKRNTRTMVLLLESSNNGFDIGRWLGEKGFVTWRANDVNHALEELSDFTVRRRPDVVLLEVPELSQRFDALRNAFHQSSGDVCVCGYAPAAGLRGERFASDLEQLTSIIYRQATPSNN